VTEDATEDAKQHWETASVNASDDTYQWVPDTERCTGSLLVSAAPARLDSNANNLVSIMHINYYKFVPILSDSGASHVK